MKLRDIGANMTELSYGFDQRVLFSYGNAVAWYDGCQYHRSTKNWGTATARHVSKWSHGFSLPREMDQDELDNLFTRGLC